MTSNKPDPITSFLQVHKKPLTKEEQAALKAKERKRRVRAQAANLNWKQPNTSTKEQQ